MRQCCVDSQFHGCAEFGFSPFFILNFKFCEQKFYHFQGYFLSIVYIQKIRMFNKANMQYRRLGGTGLQVSVLSFGNFNLREVTSFEEQVKMMKTCLTNGINYFDTAEMYTGGKDEEDLGKLLAEVKEPRENYVVSTKIWTAPNPDLNSKAGTSRKHVKESLKGSLKRLQLDYVDVVFAHSYDENSPIEEICRAFHEVIEDGLAFYWGTSNWDASKIFEALQVCEKYNLHKPCAGQNHYNMVHRKEVEEEYRTLFEKYQYGLTAFSPLLGGYLTGKYLDNKNAEGRFGSEKTGSINKKVFESVWIQGVDLEKVDKSLVELKELAEKELGADLTTLAIAWVLKFPYTSTAIFGARNVEQVEKVLKSLEVLTKLNTQIEGKVNKILDNHPNPRMNWKAFVPTAHLRPIAQ